MNEKEIIKKIIEKEVKLRQHNKMIRKVIRREVKTVTDEMCVYATNRSYYKPEQRRVSYSQMARNGYSYNIFQNSLDALFGKNRRLNVITKIKLAIVRLLIVYAFEQDAKAHCWNDVEFYAYRKTALDKIRESCKNDLDKKEHNYSLNTR